jgi:ribosomal protein S18 acetylase RimI-like enzyme
MVDLRRLRRDDLPRLRQFWIEHWAGEVVVAHGERFEPEQVQGFVSYDWIGVATYMIRGADCEIVTLDSLTPGRGIGTALVEAVIADARRHACGRLVVTTTNDNLHALGFYQKRGFGIALVRRGAVDESRLLKPSIPLIGEGGIPLHDEIALELRLRS